MALFRAVGRELLRQEREDEARQKRQKQLDYMRELDRQVEQKMQRSKSRSGQKKMTQSAVSQYEKGSSGQKMTKSLLLQQLLSMDYESFKRDRSEKSRSRSKRKYHMLQEVGNEQQYRQIKECRTVFVDRNGKSLNTDEMRDDKNYVRQEVSPQQSQMASQIVSNAEEQKEESQDDREKSPQSQLSPQSAQVTSRTNPIVKSSDLPTISNLAIFHTLNNPSYSDRLTTILNDNSHRFPKILELTKNEELRSELDELDRLLRVSINKPRKISKTVNPPDQLHEIKDILSDIQTMSKPTKRSNRLMGKEIEQHLKIEQRVSFNKTLKREGRNDKKELDDLISTYTTA